MMRTLAICCGLLLAGCALEESDEPDSPVLMLTNKPYGFDGSAQWGQNTDNHLPPKTIILTFDDGPDGRPSDAGVPSPDMTLAIASYLRDEGIHATFFVNGKRFLGQSPTPGVIVRDGQAWPTRQYPESVLDTLVGWGHRVANHTHDHGNLWENLPFLDVELLRAQQILDRHAKDGPFLFRPPYGAWGLRNDGTVEAAFGNNARADVCLDKIEGPVNWDIDGGDWSCWAPVGDGSGGIRPQYPIETCLQFYIDRVNARANHNGIVLMHDRPEYTVNTPDYYAGTGAYAATTALGPSNELALVKAFVKYLKDNGYTFGRMEDLFDGKRVRNWSYCGNYSDGEGFAGAPSYYRTLGLGDVDGDGLDDACARTGSGIACARNLGGQLAPKQIWLNDFYDSGWLPAQYGSTVQLVDVSMDNRADVCGRNSVGIRCALSNGASFTSAWTWSHSPDFSDAAGWGASEAYYGSIHFADVNGDGLRDVCGRSPNGIVCAINKLPTFFSPTSGFFYAAQPWMTADFTDAVGWGAPYYGATVQYADINGDGRADVCGRGSWGMRCALAKTNGGFDASSWWITWPDFSDSDPNATWWQAPSYYKSIRLVDVNGDGKADVCGRTRDGVVCGLSNGVSAFAKYQLVSLPAVLGPANDVTGYPAPLPAGNDFTDAFGWGGDAYGSTLQIGRLAPGRLGVCGRGGRGLMCGLMP